VAGLQTIRSLRAKGFDVKVFEQDAKVGGVWRENYVNFGVQAILGGTTLAEYLCFFLSLFRKDLDRKVYKYGIERC